MNAQQSVQLAQPSTLMQQHLAVSPCAIKGADNARSAAWLLQWQAEPCPVRGVCSRAQLGEAARGRLHCSSCSMRQGKACTAAAMHPPGECHVALRSSPVHMCGMMVPM